MNREALSQLKRVLSSIPQTKLNMSGWATNPIEGPATSVTCNTTCCAAGWAGLDPWFISQGFCLQPLSDYRILAPSWKTLKSWEATKGFFQLEDWEVEHIFSNWNYTNSRDCTKITPQDVIDHIHVVLENGDFQ